MKSVTGMTKEQGQRMTLTAILSYLPLIPIFWFVLKPILVGSVSEAMAGEVRNTVQEEVSPINNAFVALLQRDINKTRKDIAALKYRQRRADDWTEEDASYLAELEIELEALREAVAALKEKT
jgi:outer membrane murein-binding lipoprotein Lpp